MQRKTDGVGGREVHGVTQDNPQGPKEENLPADALRTQRFKKGAELPGGGFQSVSLRALQGPDISA